MSKASETLQEKRQQGSASFPCTIYRADAFSASGPAPAFLVKPHWHESVEILHFEKGVYKLNLNMEQYQIKQETFTFVGSGTLHSLSCGSGYSEQALLFHPSMLSTSTTDTAEQSIVYPLMTGNLSLPVMIQEGDEAFAEISDEYRRVLRLFEQYGRQDADQLHIHEPSAQLRVKASLLNMLASLAGAGLLAFHEQFPDPRIEAFKKVLSFIRENYPYKIYLKELAEIMNMNEQYFSRFFKKITGHSPVEYINEYRIGRASYLLRTTQLPVSEISLACGYVNAGNFITQFRKIHGVSPAKFRAG